MTKSKLGLPFEYQQYPEYFDALNINPDTDAKNAVIERTLRKHKVRTVLDLTCGTGSQVFYLTKSGYKVIGADFSLDLLKIARKRARAEKVDVKFIEGDMRTLKVGKFDAVITIFNAIGHLTKAGFEKALRNVHNNLKEGGLYVFDILNLEAMTNQAVADLSWHAHKKVKNAQIHTVQCSVIDRASGRVTAYDYVVIQKNIDKPQSFKSSFTLKIYTAQELRELLSRNGFEVISQSEMSGSKFKNKTSLNILTVARKLNP